MERQQWPTVIAAVAGVAVAALSLYRSKKNGIGCDSQEAQWLVLVRHGDRHDYANPTWKDQIQALDRFPRDPPLSTLGHRQARELGAAAAATLKRRGGAVRVLSSPYLRCLQTITPLCDALDIPLELYPEIAEVRHHPRNVAPYAERFQYFPRLVDRADPHTGADEETWPLGYLERMSSTERSLTELIDAELRKGRSTVVLTSHAASVALVSRLLNIELTIDLKLAPAGCYVFARDAKGDAWRLLRSGESNAPYVTENAKTTYPWGYRPQYLEKWANKHGGQRYPLQ
jgi:broad specificity phosphatase PhoE